MVFGKNGKVEILDDDRMGGKADLYWWGQNNTEVTIKCHVSQGVRSKAVQLSAASHTVKLVVDGKVVCHGPTCEPILPDESTFVLEDTPNGRLLTVTLVKAKETSGNEHWRCYTRPSLGFHECMLTACPRRDCVSRALSSPPELGAHIDHICSSFATQLCNQR